MTGSRIADCQSGNPESDPQSEIRNPKSKVLWLRARIVQAIRAFFIDRQYLEVETPSRIPAPAPEVHIDAVASGDWYLHTSPELAMKRLLAEGHPRLFQLCRCFREGERGRRHLPEFTLLEWYRAGTDYRGLMEEAEALVLQVAKAVGGERTLLYQGRRIDLAPPWERLKVRDAFRRYADATAESALADGSFDERLAFAIEPNLGSEGPLFLQDYPAELAALARRCPNDPDTAERFELYIAGLELANGFSELTDPIEQRARFVADAETRRRAGKAAYPSPEPFLTELADLPECAGVALGVDRLVMLLADAETIDEVVAFSPEEL